MKHCRKYQRLLHLYRDGERTAKETESLHRHLHTCDSCAKLAAEVRPADAVLEQLRGIRISPPRAEALTADILSALQQQKTAAGAKRFGSVSALILKPQFSAACVAIIVLFIGFFSFEYYGMLRSVDQLEQRFAQTSTASPEAAYELPAVNLERLLPGDTLRYLYDACGGQADNGTIHITRSAVASLEDLYGSGLGLHVGRAFRNGIGRSEIQQWTARMEKLGAFTIQFDNHGV